MLRRLYLEVPLYMHYCAEFCRTDPPFDLAALVISPLSIFLLWEQMPSVCTVDQCWQQWGVWPRHSQADGDVGHTGSSPFIAIIFASSNCRKLAAVRLTEAGGWYWGLYWAEGMTGTRQGQGDGCSLETEELPISQLPLFNTGITAKTETENVHFFGWLWLYLQFYFFDFYTFVLFFFLSVLVRDGIPELVLMLLSYETSCLLNTHTTHLKWIIMSFNAAVANFICTQDQLADTDCYIF